VLCMSFGELGEAVESVGVVDEALYWILDDETEDNDSKFLKRYGPTLSLADNFCHMHDVDRWWNQ